MKAGSNSRKRGREISTATTTIAAPINLSALQQPRPPLLVDLAKLHNHQNNVVSTGLRLSSGDHQQNQPPQQQHNHNHNLVRQSSSAFLPLLTDDFASNFKRQQDEIDQFLQAQVPIHSLTQKTSFIFHLDFYILKRVPSSFQNRKSNYGAH